MLAADPANATALNNRGNVALLEGRADSAAVYYARARAAEKDPGTILNQGLAAYARGDEKGADAFFGEALALLPDPQAAERLLGLLAPAGGQAGARRLTVEEIRQRLHRRRSGCRSRTRPRARRRMRRRLGPVRWCPR
jgi:Tfp pilus assembly protein PilF